MNEQKSNGTVQQHFFFFSPLLALPKLSQYSSTESNADSSGALFLVCSAPGPGADSSADREVLPSSHIVLLENELLVLSFQPLGSHAFHRIPCMFNLSVYPSNLFKKKLSWQISHVSVLGGRLGQLLLTAAAMYCLQHSPGFVFSAASWLGGC